MVKRILSVARSADLVLLVLDVFQPYHEDVLVNELGNIGIRLNQLPPNITIEKASMGGIAIAQQVKLTKITEKHLKGHFTSLWNCKCKGLSSEKTSHPNSYQITLQEILVISKALTILNKIDLVDKEFLKNLKTKIKVRCN